MAKITRITGNVAAFASEAEGTERTVFGGTAQSDVLTNNITADFLRGWGIVGPTDVPTMQDFNALGFTTTQILAYLHQIGVPEWDVAQEYPIGAVANVAGVLFVSLQNSNVGKTPATQPAWWMTLARAPLTSALEFEVGEGFDYATLGEALLDMHRKYRPGAIRNATSAVTLDIRDNSVGEQIILDGPIDLSWIRVISSDGDVVISREFLTEAITVDGVSRYPFFACLNGAKSPVLHATFSMDAQGTATHRDGFLAAGAGSAILGDELAIEAAAGVGLYAANGGAVSANVLTALEAGEIGVLALNGGRVIVSGALAANGCLGSAGVRADGGTVHAASIEAIASTVDGVNVLAGGAVVVAGLLDAQQATSRGIHLEGSGLVSAGSVDVNTCTVAGITATGGAIEVAGTIDASASVDSGIVLSGGAKVSAVAAIDVSGAGASGILMTSGRLTALSINAADATVYGIVLSRGATINCHRDVDCNGAGSDALSVSSDANLSCAGTLDCSGAGGHGVAVLSGRVAASTITASTAASNGINCERGDVDAATITASSAGAYGVYAAHGGRVSASTVITATACGVAGAYVLSATISGLVMNLRVGVGDDNNDVQVSAGGIVRRSSGNGGICQAAGTMTALGYISFGTYTP